MKPWEKEYVMQMLKKDGLINSASNAVGPDLGMSFSSLHHVNVNQTQTNDLKFNNLKNSTVLNSSDIGSSRVQPVNNHTCDSATASSRGRSLPPLRDKSLP